MLRVVPSERVHRIKCPYCGREIIVVLEEAEEEKKEEKSVREMFIEKGITEIHAYKRPREPERKRQHSRDEKLLSALEDFIMTKNPGDLFTFKEAYNYLVERGVFPQSDGILPSCRQKLRWALQDMIDKGVIERAGKETTKSGIITYYRIKEKKSPAEILKEMRKAELL